MSVSPLSSFSDLLLLFDKLLLYYNNPIEFNNPFSFPIISLPKLFLRKTKKSKIILCHDMMGGYLDDCIIEGGNNFHVYNFTLWQYIDIFIYFSHNSITIPPYGWIKASHIHGVSILGTLITEWEAGEKENEVLLSKYETPFEYKDPISQKIFKFTYKCTLPLIILANIFNIDGWFINIEAKMSTKNAQNMHEFLNELTIHVHKLVKSPNPQVIWYDSIIHSGELAWQNCLNEKNKIFFDNCDGIFTNYFWKDDKLDESINYCFNKDRYNDIYIGVDVFGRCKEQLGGINSYKPVHKAILKDLSVAIFAPGWTYENNKDNRIKYLQQEENLWALSNTQGIGSICGIKDILFTLPFYTTFNQGNGHYIFIHGLKMNTSSDWNNLLAQDIQPSYRYHNNIVSNSKTKWKMIYDNDNAFDGGCSIRFCGQIKHSSDYNIFKLFSFSNINDTWDTISFTTLSLTAISSLIIKYNENDYLLLSKQKDLIQIISQTISGNISLYEGNIKEDIYSNNWIKYTFIIPKTMCKIKELMVLCTPKWQDWIEEWCIDSCYTCSSLLGSLSLYKSNYKINCAVSNINYSKDDKQIKISWNSSSDTRYIDIYNNYISQNTWIGRSYIHYYTIDIQKHIKYSKIILVPQNILGESEQEISILIN